MIAGEIGSGPFGYTAIGEQVGMAQRMESVAPPGGVMLSESTARLVDAAATMGDAQMVDIKGSAESVPARRLLTIAVHGSGSTRPDTALVGRQWELTTVGAVLDRAIGGQGSIVGIAGPAGIGKSRLVREAEAMARQRELDTYSTFCESHTAEVPFHVLARLLRSATRITDLDEDSARAQVRGQFSDADDGDLLLLYDLLGIRDPLLATPDIAPDARGRRLTALINSMSLASTMPALFIIEDVHWIDSVSESMFVDFLSVIPQTRSVVLLTYRPEYRGALSHLVGAQTISLAPLSDSEAGALLGGLLGSDASVVEVSNLITQRAAGNPFFAQEMVRELAERGVLEGEPGRYRCRMDVGEISVPATLQAAIAARIDRLSSAAKQTINGAAVIGSRFTPDLLGSLGIEPTLDDLVGAALIDQVRFTPFTEYAFRHPLIRTVAYESQLKSARAELHQRLAAAIEEHDPSAADENAALIAEHLEAAGDLRGAYGWHMRAGAWAINRDVVAARLSWERARAVADSLLPDEPDRLAMRIAPRTMLCGTAWRGTPEFVTPRFEEFRELCAAAGDHASLAIGMTGLVAEHMQFGRVPEAMKLADEQTALVESLDVVLVSVAVFPTIAIRSHGGDTAGVLKWSQTVIDWAAGDPAKGSFAIGSPLAVALVLRGGVRWWLGEDGWREDLDEAAAIARTADPSTLGFVFPWCYGLGIFNGVLLADDAAIADIEAALQIAEASGDDNVLGSIKYTLSTVLMHRAGAAGNRRALDLLTQVRGMILSQRFPASELALVDLYIARDRVRTGDDDGGISEMARCVDAVFANGLCFYRTGATGLLVETLVDRGADEDLAHADSAVDRLAAKWEERPSPARDIMALRLRTMIAKARGDEAAYYEMRGRYRTMARSLGFEGHIAWAEAMR